MTSQSANCRVKRKKVSLVSSDAFPQAPFSKMRFATMPKKHRIDPSFPQRLSTLTALKGDATAASATIPRRPVTSLLSEAIPLFLIGQNKDGLWVAREEHGRIGGIFLLKRSALRFAHDNSRPLGCGTMEAAEGLELDMQNSGNPFIERFAAVFRRLHRCFVRQRSLRK